MATNTYAMTGAGGRQYSGGPHGGVNPGNDAFAGGSRTAAANPVQAGGSVTDIRASGGPPPSFGTPGTAFARNDRGSNIQIPYARVVSMHQRDKLPVEDPALTGTGRSEAYEYDGLEPAELAWIMTKQFSIKPSGGAAGGYTPFGAALGFRAISTALDLTNFGQNLLRYLNAGADGATGLRFTGGDPKYGVRGADGAIAQPAAGLGGHGVNRMERLAYTRWIEAHFKNRVGRQCINLLGATISQDGHDPLAAAMVTDNYNAALDSEIEFWSRCWNYPDYGPNPRAGAGVARGPASQGSLFAMPDIAYMLQATKPGDKLQVPVPMMQGLYVMEKGPFLRSYGAEPSPVLCELSNIEGRAGREQPLLVECDRHIGSDLAQRALLCELKKAGILNWVPDGICLSKYETGPDSGADAFFDARLGQLYNVGIQGPAITKTWTNDHELQVMPMDKVFMLVVGQLSYETAALDAGADDIVKRAAALTKAYADARFRPVTLNKNAPLNQIGDPLAGDVYNTRVPVPVADKPTQAQRDTAAEEYRTRSTADARASLTGANTALYTAYEQALLAVRTAESPPATKEDPTDRDAAAAAGRPVRQIPQTAADIEQIYQDARDAIAGLQTLVSAEQRNMVAGLDTAGDGSITGRNTDFKDDARELRNGTRKVVAAQLMNFRLMRATSSYLANRSHFKPGDPKSRCGLQIGYDAGAKTGNAEYIVGGWCIGTVVDSAASRALGHNGVKAAPSTYAINLNVNVEWWNPDKLYQHYQDRERDPLVDDPNTQRPEGTTYMRTVSPFREPAQVMKEGAINYSDAVDRLRNGTDDIEGLYKQPNPYGADTDAKRYGKIARDGNTIDTDGVNGEDRRVWRMAATTDIRANTIAEVLNGNMRP